jgi:hypothetical protein
LEIDRNGPHVDPVLGYVLLQATERVRSRLGRQGVTTVVGDRRAGKSTLAHVVVREVERMGTGRAVLVSGYELEHLRDVISRVQGTLGGEARTGDLVVVDGLDELPAVPAPDEVRWMVEQPSLRWAHILLTMRPATGAILQAHSNLVIGGRVDGDRSATVYPGEIVELSWTAEDLLRATRLASGDPAVAGEVERLLSDPEFQNAPDGGASRLKAIQRALFVLSRLPPALLVATDAVGRLRVIPASTLAEEEFSLEEDSLALRATPWLLYKRTGGLWIPHAAKLEELINDPGASEQDLQNFFEEHPHLLAGGDFERVLPHPALTRTEQGSLIPDFMLEPSSEGFADVLDLKLPAARIVAGKPDRLRHSAAVSEAIAQLREYRAWFEDPRHREAFHRRYGMLAYKPTVVVVIGRDPDVDPFELRRLWDDLPNYVAVRTYDDLLRRIRRLGAI